MSEPNQRDSRPPSTIQADQPQKTLPSSNDALRGLVGHSVFGLPKRKKTPYVRTLRGNAYVLRKMDLLDRDGPLCMRCKRKFPVEHLQIHHRNGDHYDHRLANTELRCLSCNVGESNHRRSADQGSTVRIEREKTECRPQNISWESRRKLELEATYEPVLDRLLDEGPVTVREAEDRLAKITGSDQQTVGRWIRRETTPEGAFCISERLVTDARCTRTQQFLSRKRIP